MQDSGQEHRGAHRADWLTIGKGSKGLRIERGWSKNHPDQRPDRQCGYQGRKYGWARAKSFYSQIPPKIWVGESQKLLQASSICGLDEHENAAR